MNGWAKHSGNAIVTNPCREGQPMPIMEIADLEFNVYPNPFGEQATMSFTLPADDEVSVKVFDMDGRLVNVLMDKAQLKSGTAEINYDARTLRKGLYFATIITSKFGNKTIKISSLK